MKKQHIINIGYPKCGTSWCWKMLTLQPWFSEAYNPEGNYKKKENNSLIFGQPVNQYIQQYVAGDITANFSPAMFLIDRMLISQLAQVDEIYSSIILRNPFEMYLSLYNFLDMTGKQSLDEFIHYLIAQGWFNRMDKIIHRWESEFTSKRFKVFYYDDLAAESEQFFVNFCQQLNLPAVQVVSVQRENITTYNCKNLKLQHETISTINKDIGNLEVILNKDLSHWKRTIK